MVLFICFIGLGPQVLNHDHHQRAGSVYNQDFCQRALPDMDGPKVPSVHSGKQRYLMFFPQISQPSNWETARGSFCCDYSLWRSETRTQVKPSVIKTQRKLSETIIAKANASFLINRRGTIKPFNALLPISIHYWWDLHKHLQKQFCFKFVSKVQIANTHWTPISITKRRHLRKWLRVWEHLGARQYRLLIFNRDRYP